METHRKQKATWSYSLSSRKNAPNSTFAELSAFPFFLAINIFLILYLHFIFYPVAGAGQLAAFPVDLVTGGDGFTSARCSVGCG
jgi:hypothetical protein